MAHFVVPFVGAVLAWWASRWALVSAVRRRGYLQGTSMNTRLEVELAAARLCLEEADPGKALVIKRLIWLFASTTILTILAFTWAAYGLATFGR